MMVDIIKPLPSVPILHSSSVHRRQNRLAVKQISLPVLVSTVENLPQNDCPVVLPSMKRWTGRCPGDSLRQLDTSTAPYSVHRKAIYRELAQFYPATTADISSMIKFKQQQQQQRRNSNKESLKGTTGATTTTVTSLPVVSNVVDAQSSRLFDTLSKHVTVKAEPLRSTNYVVNNTNKILSSWQRYWTSTHTQRRRKESNDLEFALYCSKRDQQPLVADTHLLTIPESSFDTNHEHDNVSRKSSARSNCSTTTNFSSPVVSNDQASFIKEDNPTSLQQLVSPFIVHLPEEKTPTMNRLKTTEDKLLTPIPSEDQITHNETHGVTTKLYKLPLPLNKQGKRHRSLTKQRSQIKSVDKKSAKLSASSEKKGTTASSANAVIPKNKQQQETLSNKSQRTSIKNHQPLSSVITTTSRSKYERIDWKEPYVGVRFDPPTPPCSPSLFVWPKDSDPDDNDTLVKQNSSKEI